MPRTLDAIASDIALVRQDLDKLHTLVADARDELIELRAAKNKLAMEFNEVLVEMYPALKGSVGS